MQGPCQKGQELILPEEKPDSPVCIPTDCDEDKVRILDHCVPIQRCAKQEMILFNLTSFTSACVDNSIEIRNLFNSAYNCKDGVVNVVGECTKTTEIGNNQVVRDVSLQGANQLRNYVRRLRARRNKRRRNGK